MEKNTCSYFGFLSWQMVDLSPQRSLVPGTCRVKGSPPEECSSCIHLGVFFFFLLYNEIVAKKHDWTSLSGLPYFPPSFIKGCWCYIYLPFSQHIKSLVPHTCCVTAPLLHPHSLPGKQVSLIVVLKPIPWYCIKEGVYGWNFIKIPYPKSWVLPHLCFSSCKQPVADKASKELRECFELVQSLLRNKWLKTYAPKSSSFVEKQNSACHFVL